MCCFTNMDLFCSKTVVLMKFVVMKCPTRLKNRELVLKV